MEQLKGIYFRRQERNPRYSLRAFARDLGVSHGYLSLVMNGRRALRPERARDFAEKLRLDAAEARVLVETTKAAYFEKPVTRKRPPGAAAEFFALDLDRFRVLSEWYHFALLDLTALSDFRPSPEWAARRLGITKSQARGAFRRLERLGLVENKHGRWRKTHRLLTVPTSVPQSTVRRFHRQMIELSLKQLRLTDVGDFERRHITGAIMAIDGKRLPEAKRRLARFRRALVAFLTEGEPDDLYALNLQLFPLGKR